MYSTGWCVCVGGCQGRGSSPALLVLSSTGGGVQTGSYFGQGTHAGVGGGMVGGVGKKEAWPLISWVPSEEGIRVSPADL